MNKPRPRILIADDHPMFRDGLSGLLDSRGFDVVGEVATGRDAVELARQLAPELIIMDLHMPDLDGVEATAQITAAIPGIAVLVLTMIDDDTSLAAALRAGARGYLLKGADQDEIIRAIEAVIHGGTIFSPSVGDKIVRHYTQASEDTHPFPELTDRERQVLQQLVTGASNADIASTLYLSPKTVRNHVSNILTKLQVTDRTQAALVARAAGIR